MAPPSGLPERRKDPALRALYNRVAALEEENAEQAREIAVLKEGAVTKGWLIGGILTIAIAAIAGAQSFRAGLEESAKRPIAALAREIAKQGEKLDRNIEAQSLVNVKTEAMYLVNVEKRSRAEVQEAVQRSIPKEK
jgi:hypothetical protein